MRSQIHFQRALGMAEMQLQRERRDQKERKGGEQGEAVCRLHGFDAKDALQRCKNEGAGHQSCDERIENDEDAPLELDFVRIHEAFDGDLQAVSFPCILSRELSPDE